MKSEHHSPSPILPVDFPKDGQGADVDGGLGVVLNVLQDTLGDLVAVGAS